jgi:diacylglycerol kinase (ATP)
MKFLLVVNPVSGKGKAPIRARVFEEEAKARGHSVRTIVTTGPKFIQEQISIELSKSRYDSIICCGGDGLVHESVQISASTDILVGVIAAGTGNDFAREITKELDSNVRLWEYIEQGIGSKIDLGYLSTHEKYFAQILSTGFDSEVNRRANAYRIKLGKLKYILATLQVLPKFKALEYTIQYGETRRNLKAMLIAVANGRSYGGGMLIAPQASRVDGLLDVMILHPVGKFELLRVFPKVFKGKHVNHRAVEFLKVPSISIDSKSSIFADGEEVGSGFVQIECAPGALRVWTDNDN